MTPEQLKASILMCAMQGKLVEQRNIEGTADELIKQIQQDKLKSSKKIKSMDVSIIMPEEELFDIPNSWKWVRLKDVMSVYGGKRIPAGKKLTKENTGHIYIRVSDMKNGSVSDADIHYVTEDVYPQISNYIISKDDVYITVAGTIGRVGIIPEMFDNANLTENADKLVIYSLDKMFVLFLLDSPIVQNQIADATTKVGQPKLAIKRIEDLLIPLPPLEEQHRIVAKIEELLPYVDRYAEAYEKLEQFNAKFPEDMKKSILQYAIQGKLVEQRPEEGSAEELYKQIQEEKAKLVKEGKIKKEKPLVDITEDEIPFDIPDNWKWVRFAEFGSYKKGPFGSALTKSIFVPKGDNTIKVYEQKNAIQKDATLGEYYITKQYYEESMSGFEVCSGDVIVSCAGTIGETYVMPENIEKGIINQALMRMKLMPSVYKPFFLMFFDVVLKKNAIKSSKGSAIKNIPPFEELKAYLVPLPPLEEQKRIVSKVEELLPYCDQLLK